MHKIKTPAGIKRRRELRYKLGGRLLVTFSTRFKVVLGLLANLIEDTINLTMDFEIDLKDKTDEIDELKICPETEN